MNVPNPCKLPAIAVFAALLLPMAIEARDAPAPYVRWAAGVLSVKAHDVKLVELLHELSRQAGFDVVPCPACGQRISLQFDRVPLREGLSILLRDQNFLLKWKHGAGAALVPQTLWVLPLADDGHPARLAAPASQRIERAPADIQSAAAQLRLALSTGTPEDREQAAADMGLRRDPSMVAPLARALADSDAQVRRAAIEALAEIGGADATGALAVALSDSDPRIREAAVNALGDIGGPAAIVLLRRTQYDATGFVRQAATETLDELKGGAGHR